MDEPKDANYEKGVDLAAPKRVWITAKVGAGVHSYRYDLNFNESATILCEGPAAERAILAIKECPHEYELAEAPALKPAK